MIKVLLADDNRFALEHVAGLVDWKKLGYSLVGMASDGLDAWTQFCRYAPDVVIADVQMPGIDGRELARKIRETKPETVIIFLSSYDEFDYARAAIDLSVQDYILKQELDEQMMTEKLAEIKNLFEAKEAKRDKIRKNYLKQCFRTPPDELDEEVYEDIFPETYGVFFVEQDHVPEEITGFSGRGTGEADAGAVTETLKRNVMGLEYCVRTEPYRFICLCGRENLDRTVLEAKSALKDLWPATFSVIVLGEKTVLQCRRELEDEAYVFRQRYFDGNGVVLYADLCERPAAVYMDVQNRQWIQWRQRLKDSDQEQFPLLLDQIFRPVISGCDYDQFTYAVEQTCKVLEERSQKLPDPFSLYGEEMGGLTSARSILRWLKEKGAELLEAERSQQGADSEEIAKAMGYVYRGYTNPMLSVEEIAEYVGLSVNRLNDLFKKERGETVGRFLTRVRLEKAVDMLEHGKEKMSEIAAGAGYSSTSYFARVFRKYYGMSPQEYRKTRRIR